MTNISTSFLGAPEAQKSPICPLIRIQRFQSCEANVSDRFYNFILSLTIPARLWYLRAVAWNWFENFDSCRDTCRAGAKLQHDHHASLKHSMFSYSDPYVCILMIQLQESTYHMCKEFAGLRTRKRLQSKIVLDVPKCKSPLDDR